MSSIFKEKIPFLSSYRNPCWLEPLPDTFPYTENRYGGKTQGYMSNLTPAWTTLYTLQKESRKVRLRCLPYFFIGGFPKCGTTDVYDKLVLHPLIQGCLFKEPHYWTRWRFWTGNLLSIGILYCQ
jgi:N-acetylgalactosamine 4-sulfate 6-O-sulfotransferase